ncbi:MAG: matrixin family metalloprotease [Deltaproteobacteria bacterium]|nr:matrixin family metalloprotease [Deltaproteobacteria bacterium]
MKHLLFLLVMIMTCDPVSALTVLRSAVEAQLNSAILIANVEILEVKAEQDPRFLARFYARASISKIHSFKDDGNAFVHVGDEISITGRGGEIDGKGIFLSGLPRPRTHKIYKAYLNRVTGNVFSVTGFEYGLQPLSLQRDFSRNRTDGSNGQGDGPYLYWQHSFFPVTYAIASSSFGALESAVTAIDASFKTWRDAPETITEFHSLGCVQDTVSENDGINKIIVISSGWPFDRGAIAITRNYYIAGPSAQAGTILDADILLNAVDHSFTTTDEPGKHDIQNIVTHEIGHILGLGHEQDPKDLDATMAAEASPNEFKKRFLHPNDLLGLNSAYGGSSASKVGFSPSLCTVPEKASMSCAAAHENENDSAPLWLAGSIALCILLGRQTRYFKRFISSLAF